MRLFSQGRLARLIAHLLTLTFIWSTWLAGVMVLPAGAQIVTRAATTQSVAVVPFDDLTGLGLDLGEEASDAVAVELRDRLLLDVLPKADVTLQMRDLGLLAPLSDVELVRLAAELEIPLLVTGQARGARILRSPDGRYAEVVLAVRLFDRVARTDTNGALITSRSPASADASDEVLIRKALEQAAFQAVEEMRARPTITAMVLWTTGDVIFMNRGSRDGMRTGMKLVAIRGGERIGAVKVTDVDATGSYADVIEGASLRTGDYLRAVFEMPTTTRAKPIRAVEKAGRRFDKLLVAAGVLFGLASFGSRARLLSEGGIAAPGFKASGLANGVELGSSPFQYSYGANLLTWEPYSGTQKKQVIGYEIRRNIGEYVDFIYLPVYGGQNFYIDTVWPQGVAIVDLTVDEDGNVGVDSDFIAYLPTYDENNVPSPTWDEFLDSNQAQIGIGYSDTDTHYGWVAGGPLVTRGHYYRIKPLTLVQRQIAPNQYVWEFNPETEFSPPNNFVVTVLPPYAFSWYYVFSGYDLGVYEIWDYYANPDTVSNLATFHFYSPRGADEMIIQVTRDPNVNFDPSGLYTQVISGIPTYWTELTVQVDLTQVPGTSSMFWWRIGARNRRSSIAPRPWPLHLTNDYGYIWSNRLNFSPSTTTRASMLHQEREALATTGLRGVRVPRTAGTDRVLRGQ